MSKSQEKHKLGRTTDYRMFAFHEKNRPVRESSRYRKLVASMKEYGFIPAHPIHCVPNGGGKMLVIDGHRRLHAASELGLPVYYVYTREARFASISPSKTSKAGEPWTIQDHVNTYKDANPDIARLDDFCCRHKISVTAAVGLLAGSINSPGSNHLDAVENGTFKILDYDFAETVATTVDELSAINKCVRFRAFIIALGKCLRVNGVNPSTLVERARKNPALLTRQAGVDEYIQVIEKIYNYRSRNPIPLAFMAREKGKSKQ
jgi:hypothetical protein